jgi:hypothetical protein
MASRIRNLLLLSSLTALAAHGQLYLLTTYLAGDTPDSPTYPAWLLRADSEGGISEVREIVPRRPGVAWVGVSYDERKALFVTDPFAEGADPLVTTGPPKAVVVDFDKADVVKKCDLPMLYRLQEWLTVQPGMGLSFEWHIAGSEQGKNDYLEGMLLDPAIPCDKSSWDPHPEDVRYVVAHGAAGMGGLVSDDNRLYLGINPKDPAGSIDTVVNHVIQLGYYVPKAFRRGPTSTRLFVSDQHVFAVSLMGDIVFFRKSDKTWHKWDVPSEISPMIRGFGRYLASAEQRISSESAGQSEWRRIDDDEGTGLGPATVNIAGASVSHGFTGRLLLLDTETMQQFSIATNQGDSEVLLVENGIVYYRAANRIYSAPIADKGIGPATLLATSELIRDAHWAFIKH